MARIRHIALFARDENQLAEFYKTAFGLKEVFRHYSEGSTEREAIYLSDGYINVAILPARGDRREGIDHFGFEVDDLNEAAEAALEAGATQGPKDLPRDGRFAEVFVRDPVGQRIDLSVRGWRTEPVEAEKVDMRTA